MYITEIIITMGLFYRGRHESGISRRARLPERETEVNDDEVHSRTANDVGLVLINLTLRQALLSSVVAMSKSSFKGFLHSDSQKFCEKLREGLSAQIRGHTAFTPGSSSSPPVCALLVRLKDRSLMTLTFWVTTVPRGTTITLGVSCVTDFSITRHSCRRTSS